MLERIKRDGNLWQKAGGLVGAVLGFLLGLYLTEKLDVEEHNGQEESGPVELTQQ